RRPSQGRAAKNRGLASLRSGHGVTGERELYRRRPQKGTPPFSAGNGPAVVSVAPEKQAAHGVEARRTSRQRGRGLQRTAGEDVAAGGAVDQLHALALPGKLHRMFADDIARTQAGVTRFGAAAGGRLAQGQRGPRG